jgi:DNA-binding NarL/FixJ family response regulator
MLIGVGMPRADGPGMSLPTLVRSNEVVEESPSAEALWQSISKGSLRIVNWYDHEERRFVVLRKATAEERIRLTVRQRKALALRAAGCALKVIAFELGVSLTTAAREVETGLELLGLDSTAALAAVLGHVAA